MTSATVPRDIRRFVARYLPTIEHIEILVLLQRNTTRTWSAAEIAAELRISEAKAAHVLECLGSDNFLDVRISNDVIYRFNPATGSLGEAVSRFVHFYTRERIAITNIATSRLWRLHDFAEAFRIKKRRGDDDNG